MPKIASLPVDTPFERWTTKGEPFVVTRGTKRRTLVRAECSCGTLKDVLVSHLRSGLSKSCGCLTRERTRQRSTTLSPSGAWLGEGWKPSSQGYMVVSMPTPDGRGTTLRQHVLVMEQHLGRGLLPHEEVHHKDGNRENNDIGNLELWSTSQPAGQRVEDKLTWAREIIALYGEESHLDTCVS